MYRNYVTAKTIPKVVLAVFYFLKHQVWNRLVSLRNKVFFDSYIITEGITFAKKPTLADYKQVEGNIMDRLFDEGNLVNVPITVLREYLKQYESEEDYERCHLIKAELKARKKLKGKDKGNDDQPQAA